MEFSERVSVAERLEMQLKLIKMVRIPIQHTLVELYSTRVQAFHRSFHLLEKI